MLSRRGLGYKSRLALLVFLPFLGGAFPQPGKAAETSDPLELFLVGSLNYHTNLLRFPSSDEAEQATGDRDASSYIRQLGGGLKLDWPVGRQKLYFNGEVFQTRYTRYEMLDYNGGHARSYLDLEMGRLLKGRVGGDYARTLSTFEFRPSVNGGPVPQDIRINYHAYADMQFQPIPEWWWLFGANRRYNDYSLPQQSSLVRDVNTGYLEFRLKAANGNYLGVGHKYSQVQYPQRTYSPGSRIDNEFNDASGYVTTSMMLSDYSVLEGRVVLVERTYRHFDQDDFITYEAQLGYKHRFANALLAELSAWRDLEGFVDAQSNYITKTGGGLKMSMPVTSKIGTMAEITGSLFKFHEADLANTGRKDGLIKTNAEVSYAVSSNVSISAGVEAGYRNSTHDQNDFKYGMLSFKASGAF